MAKRLIGPREFEELEGLVERRRGLLERFELSEAETFDALALDVLVQHTSVIPSVGTTANASSSGQSTSEIQI